jgi:hypothetical protein
MDQDSTVSSNKVIPIMAAGMLIGTSIIGGGVYIYQKKTYDQKEQQLNDQINNLKEQIRVETVTTPSPIASATPITTNPTATMPPQSSNTKTYTSSKYRFSFSYSKSWDLTEDLGSAGKSILSIFVFAKQPNERADEPIDLSIYVTDYVKPLEYPSYTPEHLKAWLEENKDYHNAKPITIGGRSGYVAEAGENKLGRGVYYFIPLADKSIVKIWDSRQDNLTKAIINSFQFAK